MSEVIKATLTADSSELQAEFAKARKTVTDYHAAVEAAQGKALASQNKQIDLLALMATGRNQEADALRQKIALEEQVAAIVKKTGLSEQQALNVAKLRASLEEKIARRADAASRLPEMPQMPLRTGDLNAAYQQTEKLRTAHKEAEKAARGQAMGLLYVAQAADDAQYGMRGILNNIPQLVMGFGGGAGLAGGISLAVLALYGLGKAINAIFDTDAAARAANAGKAFREAFDSSTDALRKDEQALALKREILKLAGQYQDQQEANLRESDGMVKSLEAELTARRSARSLAEELATAQANLVKANGGQTDDLDAQRRAREQAALKEDLKTQQDLVSRYTAETQRLNGLAAAARELVPEAGNDPRQQEIDDVRKRLVTYEALLAKRKQQYEDLKKAGKTDVKIYVSYKSTETQTDDLKSQLERLKSIQETERTARQESITRATEAAKQAQEKLDSHFKESESLKELITQREKLEKILSDTAAVEKQKRDLVASDAETELSAVRAEAEGRVKLADALRDEIRQRREAKELHDSSGMENGAALKLIQDRDRLKKQADQRPVREDLEAQMKALREEAAGRTAIATAMRDEARFKREAREISKSSGMDEAKALEIVRERDRLQKSIARSSAVRDFMGESKALQLEIGGRKDMADALRKEIQIRAQAHQLAEATGLSEAKALDLVRQRELMQRRINAGQGGAIRRSQSAINAGGGRRIGGDGNSIGGRPQLINAERRRRAEQRTVQQDGSAAAMAARYYDRSLSVQEDTLKIWKKLGIL